MANKQGIVVHITGSFCLQEKVCEESASFDLTSIDIAHCIDDVGHILKAKVEEQSASADEGEGQL